MSLDEYEQYGQYDSDWSSGEKEWKPINTKLMGKRAYYICLFKPSFVEVDDELSWLCKIKPKKGAYKLVVSLKADNIEPVTKEKTINIDKIYTEE